ncbi:MAG: hypothetical protein II755_04280 [Prevotella sp.]|nr:hypothetical protein [Prevotella sp.]
MTVSSGSYTMLSSGGNINLDAGTYVVSGKFTVSSITCKGKVKLILCDNALLTVNHGIRVNKENNNAALYIYSQSYGSSMGKIKSKIDNNSDYFGAAIGSSMKKDQGRIEIHGGHIYAEAREKASELGESGGGAGIGSGRDASGASVIIHGGNIEARGGDYAAGIGSGCEYLFNDGRNGGQLNIQGGHVEAYGGIDGVGIGGGEDADGGIIEISGGYVYAEGKDYGAGIGGGEAGDGGDVTITGGTVIAKSGILGKTGMRGIGPGYDCTIPMRPRPSTPSAPSSRFSKGCQVKTEAM